MQVDDKTFLVNSVFGLTAFAKFAQSLFDQHKYVTFTWRIGADRSLDQNALLHVWLTEYCAFLLRKDKREVSEGELEGIKKKAKRMYYAQTGAQWMVISPIDPHTGEVGKPILRSSKKYGRGEMFLFLNWLQMTAANDGLVLESRGEYAKLQRQQEAA
jgi:hypothetical protein